MAITGTSGGKSSGGYGGGGKRKPVHQSTNKSEATRRLKFLLRFHLAEAVRPFKVRDNK